MLVQDLIGSTRMHQYDELTTTACVMVPIEVMKNDQDTFIEITDVGTILELYLKQSHVVF